jgi:hypothetical protein
MTDLSALAKQWLKAKTAEAAAITARRALEDQMRSLMGVPENLEGVEKATPSGFEIKVTGRITRKVDSERLQELAAESGLSDHLSSLFRWKPELNLSVWKATDKAITTPLAPAITAEPGRPSFSISVKDA